MVKVQWTSYLNNENNSLGAAQKAYLLIIYVYQISRKSDVGRMKPFNNW